MSLFLILAGFLMTYNYYGQSRINEISLPSNVYFATYKLKNLFPLHCLTLLIIGVLLFIPYQKEYLGYILMEIPLNVLMVHTWLPLHSINGVNWYLCTCAFFYFVFPWLLKYIERMSNNTKRAVRDILFCLAIQFVIGVAANYIPMGSLPPMFQNNFGFWLTYAFPMTRLVDSFMGMLLGFIFIQLEKIWGGTLKRKIWKHILIAVGTALLIIATVFYNKEPDIGTIKYVFNFSIGSMLLIFGFALDLTVEVPGLVLRFAALIRYAFLIHFTVQKYIHVICEQVHIDYYEHGYYITLTLGLILTFVLSAAWEKIVGVKK